MKSKKTRAILNVIFSVGAAIVIFGALAKIEHWGGIWGQALIVGMLTETIVFILMAFLPPDEEYHWEKYFPHLNTTVEEEESLTGKKFVQKDLSAGVSGKGIASAAPLADKVFAEAQIDKNQLKRLGDNFEKLGNTVAQLRDLSHTVASTEELGDQTKKAALAIEEATASYRDTAESLKAFKESTSSAGEVHTQLENVAKNLSSLNSMYELQLQNSNSYTEALNKYYQNMNQVASTMQSGMEDTKKVQEQVSKLSQHLESLNDVYGNMLSAMRR